MLSKFCSCGWQVQRVQKIIIEDWACYVELESTSLTPSSGIPWRTTWVTILLLTSLGLSSQYKIKELDLMSPSPSSHSFLLCRRTKKKITTLSHLPTGPFSPGQNTRTNIQEWNLLQNYWTAEGNHCSPHPSTTCSHRDSQWEGEEKNNFDNVHIFSIPKVFFLWREVKIIRCLVILHLLAH